MRFLCVDDDPVFLKIVTGRLREQGYDDVVAAESGQAVLSLLQQEDRKFDCFLVDIQMPGMTGIELVRHLRRIQQYQKTPIVMVTQMVDKAYVDAAFSAGATDYVTKPIDELEFKSRISMVQRLNDERNLSSALAAQSKHNEGNVPFVDFSKPLLLPEVENAVEYLALENYLLTLGKRRLLGCMGLAFRLEDAEFYHQVCDPGEYVDVLTDAADAIYRGLKTHEFVISYAGGGCFVAFFPNRTEIDFELAKSEVNLTLAQLQKNHALDHLPPMRIEFGKRIENNIFITGRADKMLHRALSHVKKEGALETVVNRLISA